MDVLPLCSCFSYIICFVIWHLSCWKTKRVQSPRRRARNGCWASIFSATSVDTQKFRRWPWNRGLSLPITRLGLTPGSLATHGIVESCRKTVVFHFFDVMLVIHPHPSPTIPNFHEFSHKYNIINIQLDGFCKPSLNVASVHRWKMLKKKSTPWHQKIPMFCWKVRWKLMRR